MAQHELNPKASHKNIKSVDSMSIPNKPFPFMWHVTQPHLKYVFAVFVVITAAQLFSSGSPYIVKKIIDAATGMDTGGPMSDVWFWGMTLIVFVALTFTFWRFSGFIGMRLATGAAATGYNVLFEYVSNHSHRYFTDRFAGSIANKIAHAADGTRQMFQAFMWSGYNTFLALVITTGLVFTTNFWAGMVFLVALFIIIPMNYLLAKWRRPAVVQNSEDWSALRGQTVDVSGNMSVMRQFARRGFETQKLGDYVDNHRQSNLKQWTQSEYVLLINNIVIVAMVGGMISILLYNFESGNVGLGDFVMVITLIVDVLGRLTFIGATINSYITTYGQIEEGLEDLMIDHEVVDVEDAKPLKVEQGAMALSEVGFHYLENEDKYVFKDFNLEIPAQQKVGIVGESGAGKSTLVSLVLRQHDLHEGSISIDEQNIAEVTQESLREHIAVVPQEPMMFHRSIGENIRYGKLDATKAQIREAARMAHAHEFIKETPEGYETLVGERGVKLSGGQRQRIAIARAILKNAPILVLDEATSALDSESEVLIQEALHELMVGKTVIAIAHRLSTLREMDRIIVLEEGTVAQDGTHQELVEQEGIYKRLWSHQAGGFLQDE